MKKQKLLLILLSSFIGVAYASETAHKEKSDWFVNSNNKAGIALGGTDFTGNKKTFAISVGEALPEDKCKDSSKCYSITGEAVKLADGNYSYKNNDCSINIVDAEDYISVKGLSGSCGAPKEKMALLAQAPGIYTIKN